MCLFPAFIEEKRQAVTDLSANLQAQQEAVAKALLDLEAGSASLAAVAATNEEISAAGIEENEHTALSFEVRLSAHVMECTAYGVVDLGRLGRCTLGC